ncbi:MAG: FAD-binding oxidoreductase [Gemmatimonadota bacterium]|nr:FAD-binding oxidoreductase [Gemmatimonadota bacterium]
MQLPPGAAAVVIGGGVIGASVAWHLARLGMRDVLVLDRATAPGAGSTGRATGGYRATFATEPNIRLSLLARETLCRFPEWSGGAAVYHPVGYLWIARSEAMLATLRGANALQRRCGLTEAEIVRPDDVYRLNPAVAPDAEIRGALWCPTDGYVRPLEMLAGYRTAAEREGARFAYGVEVTGLRIGAGGAVAAVRTASGDVACSLTVNAAGPWAAQVAAWAGVALPVKPLRRQVAITEPTTALPPHMPMTLWADDGFHVRVRDDRVLYAWPTPGDPANEWSVAVDGDWVGQAERTAHERVPVLCGVAVDRARCWGGLYEVSPDKRPIIGPAPGVPNLLLANGSSGHGVMHSAAIGRLVAELATGASPTLDPAPFAPDRFERDDAVGAELL